MNSNFSSQETLGTLASDTGGKLFTDSNDFGPAFQQVQHDTEAYYIIGFRSTNPARDGSYRHLTINVIGHPDAKLEYRPGYYAPADFQHAKSEDRELALTEQMRSDVPATDVAVYLQALYFRLEDGKFYIPISVVVPGSQIHATTVKDKDKANIDFLGQVKNAQGIAVGQVRQTVPLAIDANQQLEKREHSVLHRLHAGSGQISRQVRGAREPVRQHGQLRDRHRGAGHEEDCAEAEFDCDVEPAHAEYREEGGRPAGARRAGVGSERGPRLPPGSTSLLPVRGVLADEGQGHDRDGAAAGQPKASGSPVRVLTSIEFLLGGVKVYETPTVEATAINIPERDAVGFQFDVPLAGLKPGTYVCQVNVIDDAGGSFTFPRMALRITPPAAAGTTPVAAAAAPKVAPGI